MGTVRYHPEARAELGKLPSAERAALYNAVLKLQALGQALSYPHTSNVQHAEGLRELRPRQGRSPWRALYRQYGDIWVIAAICPEAQHDPRGFRRGCVAAIKRLKELEEQ